MGAILNERFEGEAWVYQACEAVKNGVQNCFEQLRQHGVVSNARPGDAYQHYARTKEELLASQGEVADSRQVNTRARPPAPPAVILPVDESQVRDPAKDGDDGDRGERRNDDGSVPWML